MRTAASIPTSPTARTFDFFYTADDERIGVVETINNKFRYTWTVRDIDNRVLQTLVNDATGGGDSWSWKEDEIWRGAQLLANESPAGTMHYGLDHLGSPVVATSASGQSLGVQTFDPWGSRGLTGAGMMKFTGQERDGFNLGGSTMTNMPDYFHARAYDDSSFSPKFMSVDPVISTRAPHSPQMWNRYAYVGNNPMNRTDPTGTDIVLTGCQNGGGKSQACQDQTAIAQQSFGNAWGYVNNNNGVLTLKSGVSPAMLGSKFGVSARALGFMANSKDHFNMITGPVAAAMAKNFGGGRTVANAGGGANIYIDTRRFPQTLGMANVSAAEVFVHETGHAIEPYFAGAQDINAKYGMTGPAGKESFSVFLENAYRRQELGLPNNDIRMFYKRPSDIMYEGTHLEDIWP